MPVISHTANAVSGAREEYLRLGFADYLTKPVDPDQLAEMLSRENPEEAANALLEAALEAGGRDNITLLILDDLDPVLPEKDPAPVTEDEEPAPDGASGQSDGGEADG